MPTPRSRRTQKSPRWAGRFGKIGASTRSACNTLAGDFRNLVIEEPKMQRHLFWHARACLSSRSTRPSAFRLSGGAA